MAFQEYMTTQGRRGVMTELKGNSQNGKGRRMGLATLPQVGGTLHDAPIMRARKRKRKRGAQRKRSKGEKT